MQKNNLSQFVTILLLLCVFPTIANAEAWSMQDVVCYNTTALQITADQASVIQHCAWGCEGGQCLSGTDLAMSGLLILSVCWGIGIVLIWISNQINKEEDMSKTVVKILGLLMMVIGIIATLGVYEQTPHIGYTIRGLLSGIATSFPEALVLLTLFVLIVKIVETMWKGWVER